MKGKAVRTLLTTLAISTAAFMFAASASADDDMAKMSAISKAANLITPEKAAEIALAQKAGVLTDLDLDRKRKGWVYEIEVIDAQGTEWEIELEGVSGNVVNVKRDWFD